MLRAISAPASGKFRVYALDFPEDKGFLKEEMLIESVGACKRALETLQPTTRNTANPQEFPPDKLDGAGCAGLDISALCGGQAARLLGRRLPTGVTYSAVCRLELASSGAWIFRKCSGSSGRS